MLDDLEIVAGMEFGAGLVGQRLGARRIGVGNRKEYHAGCLAASRARNVPMRPAPITAIPR